MGNNNKSYRIRTKVGQEADSFLEVHLDQDYDSLEILSLKLSDKDTYRLHNSDYGVVVGRVLANGNFGVPNAKISVFISADTQNSSLEMWSLYPYTSTSTRNDDDIRYNLLPDESVKDCHKAVGTFPHKTYLLENDALLEVFDKYYIYTTRTNAAGDYLICGVPTGMQTIHMDLDLSDCGILSQRPRDFVYKGYTIEQFENPNQFKKDKNLDSLSQIFTQNLPVYVQPFWGNAENGDQIGITRADLEIAFKFEPTCVFMGSAISDNGSNGISKKCVPTNTMGLMEELTAGEGTIEMIRKTPGGNTEEFSIKGNELINGNGVWCYQIPMNLDYMMTDEYGNMVPTDDPEKGIPTRTRVRFRASLTDMEENIQSFYRAKYLIPNNPSVDEGDVDYNFGTYTEDRSYRDLFWNGVYTVKSYIPRFQKAKGWKNERFSGIKACNYYGNNNPMPYNNMRIKLPFMFTVLCIFVKLFIRIISLINRIITGFLNILSSVLLVFVNIFGGLLSANALAQGISFLTTGKDVLSSLREAATKGIADDIKRRGFHCVFIGDGLCPEMEGWYFAPSCGKGLNRDFGAIENVLMENTMASAAANGDSLEDRDKDAKDALNSTDYIDETSIDSQNTTEIEQESLCLTNDIDYLLNCFEMNLAQEYRVIKFDFYNDWVNGVIYFPRWMRKVKRKKKYKYKIERKQGSGLPGLSRVAYYKDKVLGCMNSENSRVKKSRYYTQQCSLGYREETYGKPYTEITTPVPCYQDDKAKRLEKKGLPDTRILPSKCHKKPGMLQSPIFGKKSGLVTEQSTMLGQFVYYLKPCEWVDTNNGKVRTLLFATDIVLLGTLNDCDENGIPQAFKYLNNSSYIMPTNLALTTMEDEAYIYTGKDGTICAGNKTRAKNQASNDNVESSARRLVPDYVTTYCALTETEMDAIQYSDNDDPIAVTEAAGISWNYAGPGQENIEIKYSAETPADTLARLFGGKTGPEKKTMQQLLYYPGGHFLGLSCVNSDTNIKSCVNLKRICELGAAMSQRREILSKFNSETKTPQYKYYVPTGLISDVDIEGAEFRSMFATLNFNKLIATERNETTGYKKYNFRYLRPDGFDGGLKEIVHQTDSPYNQNVSGYVRDNRLEFQKLFANIWVTPEDYDEEEVKNTERRTVEDGVNDYYMFRMGLNSFSPTEQKKHFLKREGGSYFLPQYENSFYFYFGLKDGSTALDEFKKQFFSTCESNNVMKSPTLTVIEKIDDETFEGSATVIIDNMLATYTITITDNNTKAECSFNWEDDELSLPFNELCPDIKMEIGHEYTITVTDSIDQVASKTFVFGASAVKIEYETVNFRRENVKTRTKSTSAREGGYIKIQDVINILGKDVDISSGEINFKFKRVNPETGEETDEERPDPSLYTDTNEIKQNLYFLDYAATYNVYMIYKDNTISVFSIKLEDNSDINLCYSCDWLSYKPIFKGGEYDSRVNPRNFYYYSYPKYDANVAPDPLEDGLRNVSRDEWQRNNVGVFDSAPEGRWDKWVMRHTFYRQTEDDTQPFDNHIYTKGDANLAFFGQPESGNTLIGTGGLKESGLTAPNIYRGDYNKYIGYSLDDRNCYYPTAYWDGAQEADVFNKRAVFDVMAYSDDGRAAANVLKGVVIISYNYIPSTQTVSLTYSGDDNDGNTKLETGHGAIVVFENGVKVFCTVMGASPGTGGALVGKCDYDIYPTGVTQEILAMASVYPTLQIPIIYKPFHADISAATWNVQNLTFVQDGEGKTVAQKVIEPLSYKVEGDIYNGLSFLNAFYGGTGGYETYLNFKDSYKFHMALTPPELLSTERHTPDVKTGNDHVPKRLINFSHDDVSMDPQHLWPLDFDKATESDSTWPSGNTDWGFGREIIVNPQNKIKDVDKIEYAIKEGIPVPGTSSVLSEVYTGRYSNKKIDQAFIKDSCSMENLLSTPSIKVYDTLSGLNGGWSLCVNNMEQEGLPVLVSGYTNDNSDLALKEKEGKLELRLTEVPMFDIGKGPLTKVGGSTGNMLICHGVFNGNSKNDIPGTTVTVSIDNLGPNRAITDNSKFVYAVTQDNGTKVQKTIKVFADLEGEDAVPEISGGYVTGNTKYFPPDFNVNSGRNAYATGEVLLRKSGITLSHQYILRGKYKRGDGNKGGIKEIEKVFNSAPSENLISAITTTDSEGQMIPASETQMFYSKYQTLIARYIKPRSADQTKKDRMVVYKLWPIESLDVIYPASPGGIEPYVSANKGGNYSIDAQDITITVATNVPFGAVAFEAAPGEDDSIVIASRRSPSWLTFKDGNVNQKNLKTRNTDHQEVGITIDDIEFAKVYDATVNTITIHIQKSSQQQRYAVIYLECIDDGVELFTSGGTVNPKLYTKTGICQSKIVEPEPEPGPGNNGESNTGEGN